MIEHRMLILVSSDQLDCADSQSSFFFVADGDRFSGRTFAGTTRKRNGFDLETSIHKNI